MDIAMLETPDGYGQRKPGSRWPLAATRPTGTIIDCAGVAAL